jgi:hypothetical protein
MYTTNQLITTLIVYLQNRHLITKLEKSTLHIDNTTQKSISLAKNMHTRTTLKLFSQLGLRVHYHQWNDSHQTASTTNQKSALISSKTIIESNYR